MQSQGVSYKEISKLTGVSQQTQSLWKKQFQNEGRKTVKVSNRNFWNNPNSKVTKDYVKRLKKVIALQYDIYDKEIPEILEDKTGIKFAESKICKLRNKLNITVKIKSFSFVEADTERSRAQKDHFLREHRTKISPLHC
jgi:transposase